MIFAGHRSQLTLWSIKLGFLHCKHIEEKEEEISLKKFKIKSFFVI